ncbi:MAG TPA: hypothetical protein VFF36_10825 [Planctomycetota bacterium]|nr:hypothetical protein [Planctomycetota bacterium]
MRRPLSIVALIVSAAAVSVAATVLPAYFLGAGPGTDVPFEAVSLPQTFVGALSPSDPLSSGGLTLLPGLSLKSAFAPSLHQLLEGETVITTDKQMREVWHRLFSEPYDAAQFDFGQTFVVLMGGGSIANGSFDVSAVELVQAEYAEPGGPGGGTATESFLSVTATTFLSGVQPVDPPPAQWRLSAVKIARELLDDVVFRRNLILGV